MTANDGGEEGEAETTAEVRGAEPVANPNPNSNPNPAAGPSAQSKPNPRHSHAALAAENIALKTQAAAFVEKLKKYEGMSVLSSCREELAVEKSHKARLADELESAKATCAATRAELAAEKTR